MLLEVTVWTSVSLNLQELVVVHLWMDGRFEPSLPIIEQIMYKKMVFLCFFKYIAQLVMVYLSFTLLSLQNFFFRNFPLFL